MFYNSLLKAWTIFKWSFYWLNIKAEFLFYSLVDHLTDFFSQLCFNNVVCSFVDGQYYFNHVFFDCFFILLKKKLVMSSYLFIKK